MVMVASIGWMNKETTLEDSIMTRRLRDGALVFRDLYEDDQGQKISIATSREFWIDEMEKPYPSKEEMFEKFRLQTVKSVI